MLLVRTRVDVSPGKGLGCFAAEDIPKGAVIWKVSVDTGWDYILTESAAKELPEVAQEFLKVYGGLWKGTYCLYGDNARFINHADDYNMDNDLETDISYARRDIKVGEEITDNYKAWDPEFAKDFH